MMLLYSLPFIGISVKKILWAVWRLFFTNLLRGYVLVTCLLCGVAVSALLKTYGVSFWYGCVLFQGGNPRILGFADLQVFFGMNLGNVF